LLSISHRVLPAATELSKSSREVETTVLIPCYDSQEGELTGKKQDNASYEQFD